MSTGVSADFSLWLSVEQELTVRLDLSGKG